MVFKCLVEALCEPDKIHYEPREIHCQPDWVYFDDSPAFDMFFYMVHNEPMELQEWLNTLPGSPTVSQAADHSGISKATLLRHAKTGKTTAEFTISISRAYEVNEVESLLDLGFITASAIDDYGVEAALEGATNQQLLNEILRRSDPEARYLFGNNGDEETIGLAPHLTPVSDPSDSMPLSAVAYSGPDEDAERDDAYDD